MIAVEELTAAAQECELTEITYEEFKGIVEGDKQLAEAALGLDPLDGHEYRTHICMCEQILMDIEAAPRRYIYLRMETGGEPTLRYVRKDFLRKILGPLPELL
jgi:PHP family Zn ribbon phosphoesterase